MSNPISASFDPIFMLHHTNVDRQLALWQALHPEVWISQQNQPQFANLDLTPFWKSGNAFHRSTDAPVRDFTKFRSTYPEFVGTEKLSVPEVKAWVQQRVDALYDPNNRRRGIAVNPTVGRAAPAIAGPAKSSAAGGSITSNTGATPARAAPGSRPGGAASGGGRPVQAAFSAAALSVQEALPVAPSPPGDTPATLNALQRLDWFIRVRVKKFQFGQSFTILFFLGSVPEDIAEWRTSPHLVGSHSEFVNSDPEHCANCKDNANLITEGFVGLDDLLERLGHATSSEEEIEKYIHDQIHWRIQKIDGTIVPAAEIDVLEVSVMTWDVEGDVEGPPVHHDITSGKAGGRVPGHKPYTL
jgi:tyrosinase